MERERLREIAISQHEFIEKKRYFGRKSFLLIFFVILLLVILAYGSHKAFQNYQLVRSEDNNAIVDKVSELTELPMGETPTIATVTDAESIRRQYFFRDAQVGDKVLIFNKAKKAVLYRPSTDKIISIAPLN